jgi:hypothetical protein
MVLSPLTSASIENRTTLAEVFHDRLLSKVAGGSEEEGLAALEIALHPRSFEARSHRTSDMEGTKFWRDAFDAVVRSSLNRLKELAVRDLSLCTDAVLQGLVCIEDLLNWHGADGLFRRSTYRCLLGTRPAFSDVLIRQLFSCAIGDCSDGKLEVVQNESASLGRWLLAREAPWVRFTGDMACSDYDYFLEGVIPHAGVVADLEPNDLWPDALFGAFCLFALVSELLPRRLFDKSDQLFRSVKGSNLILIARMASARSVPLTSEKLTKFITRCGLGEAQGDFIRRWIDGLVKLTDVGIEIQVELFSEIQADVEEAAREDLDEGTRDSISEPS